MKQVYGALLLLYPRDYRSLFAGEMIAVLQEAAAGREKCGGCGLLHFAVGEVSALLKGAGVEWAAKITGGGYLRRGGNADQATELWAAESAGNEGVNEIQAAEKRVELMIRRMEYAIANHQFQKARWYSDLEQRERKKLRQLQAQYRIAE